MLSHVSEFSAFLLKAVPYSIVRRYHILYIHSSVDGHVSCFRILAIIDSAALSTGVRVSFQISLFVFFGYTPGVKLLDHMVVLFLVF